MATADPPPAEPPAAGPGLAEGAAAAPAAALDDPAPDTDVPLPETDEPAEPVTGVELAPDAPADGDPPPAETPWPGPR